MVAKNTRTTVRYALWDMKREVILLEEQKKSDVKKMAKALNKQKGYTRVLPIKVTREVTTIVEKA